MGSPRRFRIANSPRAGRLIAYCLDCSLAGGEVVGVIEDVLIDELVEKVARALSGSPWFSDGEPHDLAPLARDVLRAAGFQEEGRDDG